MLFFSKSLTLVFLVSIFLSACGSSQQSEEIIPSVSTVGSFGGYTSDAIAFRDVNSSEIFQIDSNGEVSNLPSSSDENQKPVWDNRESVLKGICVTSESSSNIDIQENEIVVISPDGNILGSLIENWEPNFSPSGMWVAVACGNDGAGTTIVVSDVENFSETSGESSMEDWSREGSAKKSNLIEIFLVKIDGSRLHRLTYNTAGDWLPRWDTSGEWLLVESNRDDQSDIFLHLSNALSFSRLTSKEFQDKSPAWSREGNFIAYQSNESGSYEIVFRNLDVENIEKFQEKFLTKEKGVPISWP